MHYNEQISRKLCIIMNKYHQNNGCNQLKLSGDCINMTKFSSSLISLVLGISIVLSTVSTSFARHHCHAGEVIATSVAVGVLTAFARPVPPPPPTPPMYVPVYPSPPPLRPPYHYHPMPPPPPPHRPQHRPYWR